VNGRRSSQSSRNSNKIEKRIEILAGFAVLKRRALKIWVESFQALEPGNISKVNRKLLKMRESTIPCREKSIETKIQFCGY